jgi:hypothetical protein
LLDTNFDRLFAIVQVGRCHEHSTLAKPLTGVDIVSTPVKWPRLNLAIAQTSPVRSMTGTRKIQYLLFFKVFKHQPRYYLPQHELGKLVDSWALKSFLKQFLLLGEKESKC